MAALELKVIIPKGVLLDIRVNTVVLPGVEGDLQILPGHYPLFSPLRLGELWLDAKGENRVALFGGVVEVAENRITVLADNAELAEKIDIERAREALKRAEQRLTRAQTDEKIDISRAELALKRAVLRISVHGKGGKS